MSWDCFEDDVVKAQLFDACGKALFAVEALLHIDDKPFH